MKAAQLYHDNYFSVPSGNILAKYCASLAENPEMEYEPDGEIVPQDYHIQPFKSVMHDVCRGCGRFGSAETEQTAYAIVLVCRTKGGWNPFTRQEVEEVFWGLHRPETTFAFDQLRVRGDIFSEDGGKTFRVTTAFVERSITA